MGSEMCIRDSSIGIEMGYMKTGRNFSKFRNAVRKQIGKRIGSTSIPMGVTSYIPQISQSMNTASMSIDFGTGHEFFWTNGKLRVGGYFNTQRLTFPFKRKSAYGYLYADKGTGDINAMHDFNREKDGAFTKNTPCLLYTSPSPRDLSTSRMPSSA